MVSSHYLNQCWNIINWNKLKWNFNRNSNIFSWRKCIWKYHLRNDVHFILASMCLRRALFQCFLSKQFIWQCCLPSASECLNSLAPGRFGCNFKNSVFKLALLIGIFRASFDKVLRWKIQDLTDDKSTLVQVMAWCHQATNHLPEPMLTQIYVAVWHH